MQMHVKLKQKVFEMYMMNHQLKNFGSEARISHRRKLRVMKGLPRCNFWMKPLTRAPREARIVTQPLALEL